MKKLVIVTGAGRGIGQAIALALVKEGYYVHGCARTLSELEETKKIAGDNFFFSLVDVANTVEVNSWFEKILVKSDEFLPWGLVCAAGIHGAIGPIWKLNWNEWLKGIEINLYGSVNSVRNFSQYLIQNKLKGRIILLSGGGATKPIANFSSYCASKAAIVRFGETIADELRSYSITVNSIAPGAIYTQLTEGVIQLGKEIAGEQMYEDAIKNKLENNTSFEKPSALINYLLSDNSEKISGKLISAVWDDWKSLHLNSKIINNKDSFTLRRQVPTE